MSREILKDPTASKLDLKTIIYLFEKKIPWEITPVWLRIVKTLYHPLKSTLTKFLFKLSLPEGEGG